MGVLKQLGINILMIPLFETCENVHTYKHNFFSFSKSVNLLKSRNYELYNDLSTIINNLVNLATHVYKLFIETVLPLSAEIAQKETRQVSFLYQPFYKNRSRLFFLYGSI